MIFGEDARKKLADGINAVADAVKVGLFLLLVYARSVTASLERLLSACIRSAQWLPPFSNACVRIPGLFNLCFPFSLCVSAFTCLMENQTGHLISPSRG